MINIQEMVKEFSRTVNRLRRDFGREIQKLEMNNKKITAEMKRMITKKEPRVT